MKYVDYTIHGRPYISITESRGTHTVQLWFQDLNYQHGHSVCVTRDTVTYNPEKISSLRLVTLHVVRYGHFEIYHHSVETRQHNGRGIATSSAICSLHNKQLTIVLLGHSRKTHSMFSQRKHFRCFTGNYLALADTLAPRTSAP